MRKVVNVRNSQVLAVGIDWSQGNELIFLFVYCSFSTLTDERTKVKTAQRTRFSQRLSSVNIRAEFHKHSLFWAAPRLTVRWKKKKRHLLLRKRKGEVKKSNTEEKPLSLSFRAYMVGAATHQLKCNQLPETEQQHSHWILQPTENNLLKGI